MNLQQLLSIIKKSYALFLIFGAVGILVIGAYIYFDNPSGEQGFGNLPKLQIKSNLVKEIKLKSSSNLSMSLDRVTNVYKLNDQINEVKVGTNFGFTIQPTSEKEQLTWKEGTKKLIVDKSNFYFEFNDKVNVGAKIISADQAYEKLAKHLQELGLVGPEINLIKNDTKFLSGKFELNEVYSESEASIFVIYVGASLNNTPLITDAGSKVIYYALVGIDGTLLKLTGSIQQLIFTEKSTYPTKHLGTVRTEIEKNKAKIVYTEAPINPKVINEYSIKYQNGEVVYYLGRGKQEYLQPVLLLSSGGLYSANQLFSVLEILKDSVYQK